MYAWQALLGCPGARDGQLNLRTSTLSDFYPCRNSAQKPALDQQRKVISLATKRHSSTVDTSRLLALVNLEVRTRIIGWDAKKTYASRRLNTAIALADSDGDNATAPAFPEYPIGALLRERRGRARPVGSLRRGDQLYRRLRCDVRISTQFPQLLSRFRRGQERARVWRRPLSNFLGLTKPNARTRLLHL